MTDAEIKEWASMLTDSKMSTREYVAYLLRCSNEDKMSFRDKAICIRALKLIDSGVIHDNPPFTARPPLHCRLPLPDGLDGPEQVEVQ